MNGTVLSWIEAELEARFGLHISASLRPRVRAALAEVPRESCISDDAWLERLVELSTVQESYMFRHPQQIEAVVAHVRDRPRARIWSAACARGEEPLTVALALGLESHVELLASDVSRAAIDSAQRGVYRPWSLRNLDPHTRERAFVAEDGLFIARREWVDRIRYSHINLASVTTRWPSDLDVVLMRNVLLYFSVEQTASVLARVREVLRPDGVLVVSPAEAGLVAAHGWRPTGVGSAGCLAPGCLAPSKPPLEPPSVVMPLPKAPPMTVPPRVVSPDRTEASADPHAAQLSLARRLVREKADKEFSS